jgi:hypothetical protein
MKLNRYPIHIIILEPNETWYKRSEPSKIFGWSG